MKKLSEYNLIAISGSGDGVGKDTVGGIIQQLGKNELGSHSIKKFAQKTTEMYQGITGINYHDLKREEKEIIRPHYIQFAEGMKPIFGDDVWADALFKDYDKYSQWIITDYRFPLTEGKAIRQNGGVIIKVVKTQEEGDCAGGVDCVIVNDGTIEELVEKIRKIF